VRVLGDDGAPLPERRVGQIAIRSDCMLSGYYKRPDLQPFHDGWYLTGDMGYLAGGEFGLLQIEVAAYFADDERSVGLQRTVARNVDEVAQAKEWFVHPCRLRWRG